MRRAGATSMTSSSSPPSEFYLPPVCHALGGDVTRWRCIDCSNVSSPENASYARPTVEKDFCQATCERTGSHRPIVAKIPILQMDQNEDWWMGAGPLVVAYPLTGRSRAIVECEPAVQYRHSACLVTSRRSAQSGSGHCS